jgi:putative transposase
MPRTIRASAADICYHVLNRGNARGTVFHNANDYAAFIRLMEEAGSRVPMRILAYCLMPNHFHLVLWPSGDGDLSRWMQWLLTSHVRRYRRHYSGSGHVWQGRFKAFPIQSDEHLLTVMRYVERNPVRAPSIAVSSACMWPWSSAQRATSRDERPQLDPGPVPRRPDWLEWVDKPLSHGDELAVRNCVSRGAPFGDRSWTSEIAERLGLEASLRPRGRPKSG